MNDYKIFSALVFFFSSHRVRRFFTNQSIFFLSFKVTLPLIDVTPPTALPIMVWPVIAWLTIASLMMVSTHNGSTSNGLTPNISDPWWFDLWRFGPAALNRSTAGYPPPTLSRKLRSTSLEAQAYDRFSSSISIRLGGFSLINLSVFPFVIIVCFKGCFINWLVGFLPQIPLG